MAKNLILDPILADLTQIYAPNFFFHEFYLYYMLHNYHFTSNITVCNSKEN